VGAFVGDLSGDHRLLGDVMHEIELETRDALVGCWKGQKNPM
jgi:hypothetical protein